MKRTVELEQYYTSREVATRCVEFLNSHYNLATFDLVVEPSAGEGSFYELLPSATRVGLDLEPRCDGVESADYMTWSPPPTKSNVLTIGNPPFGQRAAQAVAFLEKASMYSNVIGFILPRSFKKYTFQNRVPKYFHLVGEFDCDEFYGYGREHSIRTVFQVWEKRPAVRAKVKPAADHPDFEMRHCHLSRVKPGELETLRADYEFAIPQVGMYFHPRSPSDLTKGSYWFIKPLVPGVRERFSNLNFDFLDGMNTAHKSLSKRDIVSAYKVVLEDGFEAGPTLDAGRAESAAAARADGCAQLSFDVS